MRHKIQEVPANFRCSRSVAVDIRHEVWETLWERDISEDGGGLKHGALSEGRIWLLIGRVWEFKDPLTEHLHWAEVISDHPRFRKTDE